MIQQPWPFPTAASHPKPEQSDMPEPPQTVEVQDVSEPTLDHAVEESFPASDPVSVVATKVVSDKGAEKALDKASDNPPSRQPGNPGAPQS